VEATRRYHRALPGSPAEDYLGTRGLTAPSVHEKVEQFQLGYVAEPMAGHEHYRGWLAIPYLRWSQQRGLSVVTMRFRRLTDEQPKYLSQTGDQDWLYNTRALIKHSPVVAITEGEFDAITAHISGVPAVGVSGAAKWKPYFRELFLGYREVFVLADGDDAGMQFAQTVAKTLPNAKVIPMPTGEDCNSLVIEQGPQALLGRLK
jgi:DNA primase